jgi:predicted nuclease of predicted toxin-antitoxin system
LYLDEGISGTTLASLLRKAKLVVFEYEELLERNKKIPDATVLKRAVEAGYVLVSKDGNMESDELEYIIEHRARVIFLDDQEGGPVSWAAALICAESAYERVLLSNPSGPLTIHVSRIGTIRAVTGEEELRRRCDRIQTAHITRRKRHQKIVPTGTGRN